jgi:hypothetical protein
MSSRRAPGPGDCSINPSTRNITFDFVDLNRHNTCSLLTATIENLDKFLMLTIQSVCNNHGVKIPWDEVAKVMGHPITEGAVVQHLAKLRQRLEEAGHPVPPPLRRGGATPIKVSTGVGAAALMGGTTASVTKGLKRKSRPTKGAGGEDDGDAEKSSGMDEEYGGSPKKRGKTGSSKKVVNINIDDSSDEYRVPAKKTRVKAKKARYDSDDDYDGPPAAPDAKPTTIRACKPDIDYVELNGGEDFESGTEAGSSGSRQAEEKYGAGDAYLNFKKSKDKREISNVRSKVIVLPVCLASQRSESCPGNKVIEDEDCNSKLESPMSNRIGSVEVSSVFQNTEQDEESGPIVQQSATAQPPILDDPASLPPLSYPVAQNNSHSSGLYGYMRPTGRPGPFPAPPPRLLNNPRFFQSNGRHGMRIDTIIPWTIPSTGADTSSSSMNPSPSGTVVQSPQDISFQNLLSGSFGGQGGNDSSNFPQSSFGASDSSWMNNLLPGSFFAESNGGSEFDFGGSNPFN